MVPTSFLFCDPQLLPLCYWFWSASRGRENLFAGAFSTTPSHFSVCLWDWPCTDREREILPSAPNGAEYRRRSLPGNALYPQLWLSWSGTCVHLSSAPWAEYGSKTSERKSSTMVRDKGGHMLGSQPTMIFPVEKSELKLYVCNFLRDSLCFKPHGKWSVCLLWIAAKIKGKIKPWGDLRTYLKLNPLRQYINQFILPSVAMLVTNNTKMNRVRFKPSRSLQITQQYPWEHKTKVEISHQFPAQVISTSVPVCGRLWLWWLWGPDTWVLSYQVPTLGLWQVTSFLHLCWLYLQKDIVVTKCVNILETVTFSKCSLNILHFHYCHCQLRNFVISETQDSFGFSTNRRTALSGRVVLVLSS